MTQENFCKHYNGSWHNKTCDAGVCYADVTPHPELPGSAIRQPCHRDYDKHALETFDLYGPPGICDKYKEPTAEERAEEEKAFEASLIRLQRSIPLINRIKQEHKGEDWVGYEVCPVCECAIWMSHAAMNGHVWGKCETEGCLNWME